MKKTTAMLLILLFLLASCGQETGITDENLATAEEILTVADSYLDGYTDAKSTYNSVSSLRDELATQKSDEYKELDSVLQELKHELFLATQGTDGNYTWVTIKRNSLANVLGEDAYTHLEEASTSFGYLFDTGFIYLMNQVGTMTYEECIQYFGNTNYETVGKYDPSQMCQISLTDSGATLSVLFYPKDDEDITSDYTVTTVTFTSGEYGCCASDSLHMETEFYELYVQGESARRMTDTGLILFMESVSP